MLRVLGPFSRNKSNWYLLGCWALSVTILALPQPPKSSAANLIWQILYAPFYQAGEKIRGLYQVQRENHELRKDLAALTVENNILEEERLENQRLRQLLEFKNILDFEVIPAEVIARDPNFRVNTVLISAGARLGVQRYLPVIDIRGLVGKVTEAFPDYSSVQMLFDPGFKVSGLVQRSRVAGIVAWKGGQLLELEYVPSAADVQVGDEIVTSGLSRIYPTGLKIGRVTRVSRDPQSLFKIVEISPFADLYNVEELFIIKTFIP
jgi:rod shape-determining protein MreC